MFEQIYIDLSSLRVFSLCGEKRNVLLKVEDESSICSIRPSRLGVFSPLSGLLSLWGLRNDVEFIGESKGRLNIAMWCCYSHSTTTISFHTYQPVQLRTLSAVLHTVTGIPKQISKKHKLIRKSQSAQEWAHTTRITYLFPPWCLRSLCITFVTANSSDERFSDNNRKCHASDAVYSTVRVESVGSHLPPGQNRPIVLFLCVCVASVLSTSFHALYTSPET